MEVKIYEDKKIVAVWLTNAERKDEYLRQQLGQIYEKYKGRKYKVVEFHSGAEDLYACTRDLVVYNRKRMAQLEVQREKLTGLPPILTGHSEVHPLQC